MTKSTTIGAAEGQGNTTKRDPGSPALSETEGIIAFDPIRGEWLARAANINAPSAFDTEAKAMKWLYAMGVRKVYVRQC